MRKNKILKIFVAIVLLISIETSAIAATTGVVNTDTVRVRAKASTDSGIVALVSIGDKVTIIGEDGNWYKVQAKDEDGNTKTGYIRKDLLTVNGETGKVTTENPTEDNNTDQNTNTNETPNQTGESVDNTETPNAQDSDGETEAPNGQDSSGETEAPNVTTTIKENDKTISTIKSANGVSAGKKVQLTAETKIKILPSANSSNIAILQANTEVTVLEVINNWCRIETEGACGWVRIDQ